MTARHNVKPALEPLLTALDTVRPHPLNARNGDLDAITDSLSAHGQYAPIVAQRSTGHVLKGNHVYAAMLGLGWTHGAVTLLDVDDDTATRILLVDNRTSDLGQYDDPLLADLLSDLDGLEHTGYDDRDLSRLLAKIEAQSQRDLDAEGEDSRGLGGEAIVSYTLVFDSSGQQNRWYAYLKWLRQTRPGDTIGERIYDHLGEVLGDSLGDLAP